MVKAVPYVGKGSTTVRLFDGSYHFRQPTWGYEIELKWDNMTSANLTLFRDALMRLITDNVAGNAINIYVKQTNTGPSAPTFHSGKVLFGVMPDISDDNIMSTHKKRFRSRSAILMLRTKLTNFATPYDWLSE